MEKTKTKRKATVGIVVACLIIILLAALLAFAHYYTVFNGGIVSRNMEYIELGNTGKSEVSAITRFKAPKTIDLRDAAVTVEDVKMLQTKFPDCRIIWTVNICVLSRNTLQKRNIIFLNNICFKHFIPNIG